MGNPVRTFEDKPAVRGHVPLIIGITGASFSGKTWSALRLATGVQRVTGGDIYGIDTEAGRMEHYAEFFKFRHVPFAPPHGPLDYMAAIDHCVAKGAKIVVIDQCTSEHSGEGGVLDQAETFLDKKCGDDWKCREKNLMLSLIRPKAQRKKLNRRIVQLSGVVFILCYRAEQKIKPVRGGEPIHLGWTADTTSPLAYDMTCRFLLTPGSDGKPDFAPEEAAARLAIKQPQQFRDWFKPGLQLSEDVGEKLARWAAGDASGVASPAPGAPSSAPAPKPREADTLKSVGNEIWELMGKPDRASWFVDKFGKMRADCTLAELIEYRNVLELEK